MRTLLVDLMFVLPSLEGIENSDFRRSSVSEMTSAIGAEAKRTDFGSEIVLRGWNCSLNLVPMPWTSRGSLLSRLTLPIPGLA